MGIRVVVVEDHPLFREGLKLILASNGIAIEADYGNGEFFLHDLERLHPDVVLMDIAMPGIDGVETSRRAIFQKPDLKIIALSMFGDEDYYFKMISVGVKGFLIKESNPEELIEGVTKVAGGESFFSQDLLRKIIFRYGSLKHAKDKVEINTFSDRELEVLTYLCKGMTNAEVAEKLHLSQRTVEGHRASMLHKTDTKNTVALIMHAIKAGLVKI